MATRAGRDRLSYLVNSIQIQNTGLASWDESIRSPAVYFLSQVVNLNKSLRYCMEQFPSKDKATSRVGYKPIEKLTPEGQQVIFRLSAAAFVAMMGHFEIYQRSFLAGLFDATRFIRSLDMDAAMRGIFGDGKDSSVRMIDFAAYRGQPAYIGRLLTDSLTVWHNPQRINSIVKSMLPRVDFYAAEDVRYLNCLWQIRHSIAHSGGWLTPPDAQRIPELHGMGGQPISFDHNFIRQIHEEFHAVVHNSVGRTATAFRDRIAADYSKEEATRIIGSEEIECLFKVDSPRQSQLRRLT